MLYEAERAMAKYDEELPLPPGSIVGEDQNDAGEGASDDGHLQSPIEPVAMG